MTPNVVRRIPWELVQAIEPGVVRIGTTSGELGFGTAHHAGAKWVDELGQATLRISSVLATPVVGPRGEAMGRVHEVQARMEGSSALKRGSPAFQFMQKRGRRCIVAGGLKPENVGEAILTVRPYAVDVASGVESRSGIKDPAKLRDFFAEVTRANRALAATK